MKLYDMVRIEDVSGTSGTGNIAEIVEFENGKVVVAWRIGTPDGPNVSNVIVYNSIEDCETIHGHGGATRIVAR